MMTSDLPPDLVEEILSRVPATTLSRFRFTCKRWNALFKDEKFTKKHLDRAAKQVLVLMLNEHKISPLSVDLHGIDNNTVVPSIEFKSELSLKESHSFSGHVDIFGVFHCDGLLLCTTKNNRLVVWNPCTGETRWIIPSNQYYKYSMFALGYENSKYCRSYKLLRYRSNHDTNHPVVEFEIYDFSSGSWRFLEITANFLLRTDGVSLKGNTYWLAYDNHLLCFDFSTERLEFLSLPFHDTCCCTAALSMVREEQLSVLHHRFDTLKMIIWVTTIDKIDQTIILPWRIFLAIDISKLSSCHKFSSLVSFFIDEEKKVAVCYDSGRGDKTIRNMVSVIREYGEIHFGKPIYKSGRAVIFGYAPSLVQINQGTVIPRSGKRKERN